MTLVTLVCETIDNAGLDLGGLGAGAARFDDLPACGITWSSVRMTAEDRIVFQAVQRTRVGVVFLRAAAPLPTSHLPCCRAVGAESSAR